jgi:hypothetical protein
VLAEEGGLIADAVLHLNKWTQFSANSIQTDGSRESNQLRYVCRQLYEETSRLCLRYNDLTFCCQDETARRNFITVYDVFDHFHNNCAQHLLGDIRRITKLDDATDPPTVLTNFEDLLSPPLVRYCREFPQATVLVRFEWVDANPYLKHSSGQILSQVTPGKFSVDCQTSWRIISGPLIVRETSAFLALIYLMERELRRIRIGLVGMLEIASSG